MIKLHCFKDVSTMNNACYWFEKFAWWRLTNEAECFSDVIGNWHSAYAIDDEAVNAMSYAINNLNFAYCDDKIKDVTDNPVKLQSKKFYIGIQHSMVFFNDIHLI